MTRPQAAHIFTGMRASPPSLARTAPEIRWGRALAGAALGLWGMVLALRENPWSFLDWVNLAFHEAGHLFLLPFGETLHFLGGTLFQLLIPGLLSARFLVKRNPFAASACAWWLGQNFLGIAFYMADARELKLPLVGGGENDWNYLFYQWGLLGEDSVRRLASATHGIGLVIMLAASLWMLFLALPEERQEALTGGLAGRFPWVLAFCSRGEEA